MTLVGKKVGPYAIVSELGSGGMAVVYKADQPSLKRSVAIKELRTEFVSDQAIVVRFEREAHSIAQLAHQNIVHVYDFVTRGTSMFIVMEYVDGIDVYELLNRVERLPPDIAAIIALQAARALEYAHFHGVIHRDFKPSNLMITKQGDVKLMDFGIARDETKDDLTRPGQALGTPSYMSPEQIMGERVDFRSDIFSFGIVLYQMVTGKKPFMDDETVSVMQRILNEPYVKPRALFPDIPWGLQKIIRRCLQKNPKSRYRSTEHLRRDLERFVEQQVHINYNGRLLIYLSHRNIITDNEAKTFVRDEDLRAPNTASIDTGGIGVREALLKPLLTIHAAGLLLLLLSGATFEWSSVGQEAGFVRVSAAPWAEVWIDGELRETTPVAAPIPISPGRHQVEFRNPSFETLIREVTVESGETRRMHVELQRRE